MQYCITYNKFTGGWVFGLQMLVATTVIADSNIYQPMTQYPQQAIGGQSDPRQSNPWALPQQQERVPDYQQSPKYQGQQYQGQQYQGQQYQGQQYQGQQYQGQQYQGGETSKQRQGFRFVTPEILESLKRQQTQTQLMPGNGQNQQYQPRQSTQGYYSSPSPGMSYTDPIYEPQAFSPWGSGPDTLYRGESFPWVPNEAIGGIPPIPVTSFGENISSGDADSTEKQKQGKVFNPFTFIRD